MYFSLDMRPPTSFVVQIVHLQGPFKGQIQEFSDAVITIGRHPSCQVRFPPDLNIVSRKHAEIVREGNRFKLIDHSKNGTFLNGKPVKEAYLRNGDVITFAEGGPKVSFLAEPKEAPKTVEAPETPSPSHEARAPEPPPPQEPPPAAAVKAKVSLVIQYGPLIKSFHELPITVGKGRDCQFVLDLPQLLERHLEISFAEGRYWVKDLSQKARINGQRLPAPRPLEVNDVLSLTPEGPHFRFLGEGRMAEVQVEPPKEEQVERGPAEGAQEQKTTGGLISSLKRKLWKS